jgi:hypothetical protein
MTTKLHLISHYFLQVQFKQTHSQISQENKMGRFIISKDQDTVKSLIFVWVLFSQGWYDRENKTREYENI